MIEVIVVAAIIAILAGILVPMIFNQIDESKISRAKGDAKSIQTAFLSFRKDLGKWANNIDPTVTPPTKYTLLHGAGYTVGVHDTVLSVQGYTAAPAGTLDAQLVSNGIGYPTTGESKWRGPYMTDIQADPWGNPYVVDATGLDDPLNPAVWVLSAGPNGTFETARGATVLVEDDIGVRIK